MEGFLHELAERSAGTLVAELPRQPGARETSWAHLLSGPPAAQDIAAHVPVPIHEADAVAVTELAAVKANLARLDAEVSELKTLLAKVCTELGIRI